MIHMLIEHVHKALASVKEKNILLYQLLLNFNINEKRIIPFHVNFVC